MAVLMIVGLARSGKDTVADYLAEKYKFYKLTFSSVLAEALEQKGVPATKQNMIELGDELRKEFGMDALAKLLAKKVLRDDRLALVGPRSIDEAQFFRKKYPEMKIVKVTAADESRYTRRSRADPEDKKGFFGRDEADLRTKGMQKVLDAAEFELKNNEDREKLYSQIDALVRKIGL